MKRSSLVLIPILIFIIQCNSPKSVESKSKNPEMSIKKQIEKGAFLVDVRTPEEFAEGSVKGAVNIPLDQVESRVNEFKGKSSVIVFCRTGNRSEQAIEILEKNGIKNIENGINAENIEKEIK